MKNCSTVAEVISQIEWEGAISGAGQNTNWHLPNAICILLQGKRKVTWQAPWWMSTIWGKCGGWDAGHVVSWGMEGHASNASNATASGLAGSPTTHWPPPTRPSFLHNGDTSSFNPLSPVGALYQMVWLCLAVEGPPAGRPIIGLLSPAQFETNHRETRWASDGRWRMEENTNSEIQSQDWYNQVAHKKKSKLENLEIKENWIISSIQSQDCYIWDKKSYWSAISRIST